MKNKIKIGQIEAQLDIIAGQILEKTNNDNRFFHAMGYWQTPAVNANDLATLARQLAAEIQSKNIHESEHLPLLEDISKQLESLQQNIIANFAINQNLIYLVSAYVITLETIRHKINTAIPTWVDDPSSTQIPRELKRRISSLEYRIKKSSDETENLEEKINAINSAYHAAINFPSDLEELDLALEKANDLENKAEEINEKITKNLTSSDAKVEEINKKTIAAEKLIKKLDDLYRIGTSTALAGAFNERASTLKISIRWWTVALVSALVGILAIGYYKIEPLVTPLINQNQLEVRTVFSTLLLSVLGLGAPVWFAWVATKQIGQRFRLAEDYAYKASISAAYEGYRREAIELDDLLAEQLFASALKHLDEQPLRLVESSVHGSPFHEIMNSWRGKERRSGSQKVTQSTATSDDNVDDA